jgi:hypothetical protein
VQFARSPIRTDESMYVTRLRVTRTGSGYGDVCVGYRVVGGTSTADVDYRYQPYVACWHNGETGERRLDIIVYADDEIEGTETVLLELDPPSGLATLGPQSAATLKIADA